MTYNELDIMKQVVKVIQDHIEEFLPEAYSFTDEQVILDFPDVDKMPYSVCIYVNPEYSEIEPNATDCDEVTFRLGVFVLCKRDTQSNLTEKYFTYYNALYYLLRKYTSLDGYVNETKVTDVDFYPNIEGNLNVRGSRIAIQTIFVRDF